MGRWLDEGPRCIQLMKRLVKALCYRSHKNCLANTDFNFLKTQLSFVTFPLGLFDDDSDSDQATREAVEKIAKSCKLPSSTIGIYRL